MAAALSVHAVSPRAASAGQAEIQAQESDTTASEKIGYGAQVLLTNSGFGLGGFLTRGAGRNLTIVLDAGISPLRDEREVAFFDRFGQKEVPNKANYFIEVPVQIGFQRRIFRSRIEDNFRPFFQASAGPTFGWKYPYFEDENDNGLIERDERVYGVVSGVGRGTPEFGVGGSLTLGANFGDFGRTAYGVRIGYRFTRFRNPVELIDESIKSPERFIGSPVLMIYFGALRH
ncbi:MAG: hypothetical protein HKN17_04530 [Rhodothermales bacterium]|nr:hypothetical protein [Rhodothermales bacterium]